MRADGSLATFAPAPLLALASLLGACAPEAAVDPAAAAAGLRDVRHAADEAERVFGVPADLVLVTAYVESRWRPPRTSTTHADHAAVVGLAGLRPHLGHVELAAEQLAVRPARLAQDAALSVFAAGAVMRALADSRSGDPSSSDPAEWREVLADYVGLEHAAARASYARDVLDLLRRGVSAELPDDSMLVVHAREVAAPERSEVAARVEALHSEYAPALFVPAHSSNYSSRLGESIQYVIVHTTQGSYGGTVSWFQNPSSNVSTHYVVRSSDGEVTQMLHEADNGWHAGNSTYNRQSIGIEHEGFVDDPARWYTDAMYASSADLVRYLCDKYEIPIDRDHIIGHVEVPGSSHTDPGSGWDWDRFMALVRGEPEGPAYEASLGATEIPAAMVSGERAVAWVEFRNEGAATWRLDRTRLGTASPEDHDSPFYDMENWLAANRATPPDRGDYGPGSTGRFTFMVTAPEVASEQLVTDTLRLVEEGIGWFGDEITLSIRVRPGTESEPGVDLDGDGALSPADCDDSDMTVYPGAPELCGDGVDQDCDSSDPPCEGDAGATPPDAGTPADAGALPDADAGDPRSTDPTLSGGCSAAPDTRMGDSAPMFLLALALWRRRH